MILKMFSILDAKVGTYSPPFYMPTVAAGLRAFADVASTPDNNIGKHPEDYSLFQIGEYDDSIGEVKMMTHVALGNAASFLTNRYPGEALGTPVTMEDVKRAMSVNNDKRVDELREMSVNGNK